MDFDEYQSKAMTTAIYPGFRNGNYNYPTLGLCGESGEVANLVKKVYRDDAGLLSSERRAVLVKELGDVLWYVAALCEEIDVPMNAVAGLNLTKLSNRMDTGNIKGSGDNR